MQDDIGNVVSVRQAIDSALESLGGPIHKTILWHMNNRGIFSDLKKIDIESFYSNLQELVGPGADMIMEEAWQRLTEQKVNYDSEGSILDKMMKMIGSESGE